MSRSESNCIRSAILVLWLGGIVLFPVPGASDDAPVAGRTLSADQVEKAEEPLLHLYFADQGGNYLQAEERLLPSSSTGADRARLVVEALIKGSRNGLVRTIPEETELRALYLAADATAYVDFSSAVRDRHPGGCNTEILTIYSIVNSMILNVAGVDKVKILVEGRESPTLAGHIDTRHPFTADMLLMR